MRGVTDHSACPLQQHDQRGSHAASAKHTNFLTANLIRSHPSFGRLSSGVMERLVDLQLAS